MAQRLLSAAVLVPVVIIVFLLGDPWLTMGIAVLGVLAGYEVAALVRRAGLAADTVAAVAAPILAVLAFQLLIPPTGIELGWLLIAPAVAGWLMIMAAQSLRHHDPLTGFRSWSGSLLASAYPSLLAFAAGLVALGHAAQPAQASVTLFNLDLGRTWLLVLAATVWSLDSAAYLTGRYLPRGRFMAHISPHKTWSGVVGGTAAAVAVCAGLFALMGQAVLLGAGLGLLIAVAAQAGDLVESMLKRAAGTKDSGTLIPGHGGFLDRVDSFLFAAPALYIVLVTVDLLHRGGVV
jgi:phosphatidate cytidylyltransferase